MAINSNGFSFISCLKKTTTRENSLFVFIVHSLWCRILCIFSPRCMHRGAQLYGSVFCCNSCSNCFTPKYNRFYRCINNVVQLNHLFCQKSQSFTLSQCVLGVGCTPSRNSPINPQIVRHTYHTLSYIFIISFH